MPKKETFVQALVAILQQNKVINEEESLAMQKAFKESSKAVFDDFLLEEGLIDEEALLEALADYYKVPAFDVVGYFFDTFLLRKFPKDFLLRNAIIPLEVDENIMIMIANNPNDPDLLPKIGGHVSYDIQFRVGLMRDICDAVKEFYDESLTEVKEDIDLREVHREEKEIHRMEDEEEVVIYEEEELD